MIRMISKNNHGLGKLKLEKLEHRHKKLCVISVALILYLLPLLLLITVSIISAPTLAEVEGSALGTGVGRFNAVVADDIDNDGNCEIVFGNYEGFIVVLEYSDFDFTEEWRSEKLGHRMWGITVADFIGDETKEIIAGNGDGDLYAFDGKTKKLVWHATDLVRDVHGLLVHDLGTGDTQYLLAGTGYKTDKDLGTVYIFTAESTEPIAELGQFENRMRGLGVGDLDSDGVLELVVGSGVATGERPGEGYVRVYDVNKVLENDYEAGLEWKSENLKGDCVAVELADFTGDGYPDIVVGNGYRYQAGWVRVIAYDMSIKNYTEYWKSPDIGPKPYGLSVGDLDDDEKLDIVVGNQPGYIYIYEQTGTSIEKVWRSELLGTDILGIDIADVDKDGQQEIIATQGGYIGKGDYTSGYSDPHIYIIDGKTHDIEIKLGETHPLGFILQLSILVLFILFLLGLNYYLKFRKRLKEFKTVSQKIPSRPGGAIYASPIDASVLIDNKPKPAIAEPTIKSIMNPQTTKLTSSSHTTALTPRPAQTAVPVHASVTASPPVVNDPFAKPPVVNDPFKPHEQKPLNTSQDAQEGTE